MPPPSEDLIAVYQRLLANEPDASLDLIELVLDPMIFTLRGRYPALADTTIIEDIVTDSLLKFVQEPGRYNPQRGNLWHYLYMDALGDLHNTWEKEQRRRNREVPLDLVAHDQADRNSNIEEDVIQRIAPGSLPAGWDVKDVLAQLRQDISDPRDWQVIMLMAQGERRTSVFANVLGISDLAVTEQRKRVKQAKDRLRLWLKRRGANLHEQ